MELLPPGQLTFEVTFNASDLNVGMRVWDVSGPSPILASGPVAMPNVPGTNTYVGKFTAASGKSYLVVKAVYSDPGLTSLNHMYFAGSETFVTGEIGFSSVNQIVGFVNQGRIFGVVDDKGIMGLSREQRVFGDVEPSEIIAASDPEPGIDGGVEC